MHSKNRAITGVVVVGLALGSLMIVQPAAAEDGGILVTSSDMSDGTAMNPLFACDGDVVIGPIGGRMSPQLSWSNAPAGTQTFMVLMHDEFGADAAYDAADWSHWAAYNVGAATTSLDRDASAMNAIGGGTQAANTWGELGGFGVEGYIGPCPPSGDHQYFFTVYALDAAITPVGTGIGGIVTTADMLAAAAGHILDQGDIGVTFADAAVGTARADIELTTNGSDVEATGGNLPVILVNGEVAVPTTVTLTLTSTATPGTDYTPAGPIVVTIPPGIYDGTLATAVAIPDFAVTDDAIDEPDETVIFSLGTPTGNANLTDANHNGVFIGSSTYTITDDDVPVPVPVTVELSADASSPEATGGSLPVLLVNGTLAAPATIVVTTSGTATEGDDYEFGSPVTVTIPAGTYDGTAATAIVLPGLTITDDTVDESDETIVFTLSAPEGVVIGDANGDQTTDDSATFTLVDDDVVVTEPPATTPPPVVPPAPVTPASTGSGVLAETGVSNAGMLAVLSALLVAAGAGFLMRRRSIAAGE